MITKFAVFIIGIIFICAGCVDKNKPYVNLPKTIGATDEEGNVNYFTVTIEGCEYIYIPQGNATVMSHKGNCSNPIHLYQYQIEKTNRENVSTNKLGQNNASNSNK